MPYVLSDSCPISRVQGPDWLPWHAGIAGHDGHDSVFYDEAKERRQRMSVDLLLVTLLALWVAPFVAVLAGE